SFPKLLSPGLGTGGSSPRGSGLVLFQQHSRSRQGDPDPPRWHLIRKRLRGVEPRVLRRRLQENPQIGWGSPSAAGNRRKGISDFGTRVPQQPEVSGCVRFRPLAFSPAKGA
ncbi:hypothetical protein H1C71_026622, partial [Ictidomys tridecemlineatus]